MRTHPDRTLAEQLSSAFFVFGALVATAFVVTTLTYGVGRILLAPELERSRLAEKAESTSHVAILREETALLGYLLTRDAAILERANRDLPEASTASPTNLTLVPELAAAMIATRLAEERWREGWAKAAADTRPDVVPPSMAKGIALFDAYRREQTVFAAAPPATPTESAA